MSSDLARKLQLRDRPIRLVNPPDDFAIDAPAADPSADDAAVLVFVKSRAELDAHGDAAVEAARADQLAWIAYPKAGQLGTDLNRDSLVATLHERGCRGVRQVALDHTWSALRFRPA